MTFKKSVRFIHLVLGLISGPVILLLAITGCILAFEIEIRGIAESFRNVKAQDQPYLAPTVLRRISDSCLHSKKTISLEYPGKNKAVIAAYYDETNYELAFLDPYTGEVLRHKDMTKDFFRIVLDGHYYLWLPHHIGQPVAATATLIFLLLLISGIILWWPKNKAARKQRFSVKWNARWKRRNYDLHNVLGFYMTWVGIFLAITGLVMGFQWFASSFYRITNGGAPMTFATPVVSDTTKASPINMTDKIWKQQIALQKEKQSLIVYFPQSAAAPLEVVWNHRPGTFYNTENLYYDQYTGKSLPVGGSYAGRFSEAKTADKILRMNYDVHVGAIGGLPGKMLVFFASFIAASLPVTGFLIWKGKRRW